MAVMLGILVGNVLFGYLSDKHGRKMPLVIAVLIQLLAGAGAAFSPWFWVFVLLRFISTVATGGTMVISFVLVMEIVGSKWRTVVGVVYQLPFNLGHLSMALIAYCIRDWRYFQLSLSLPSILLLSYFWIIPESPRWLLAKGRVEKAADVLERAARVNGKDPTKARNEAMKASEELQGETEKNSSRGDIRDLVRTPKLRLRFFFTAYNWVVCGLCFFGLAQYVGHGDGDIFVNVAFTALVTIPGTLLSTWLMDKIGRRMLLFWSNVLAGIALLAVPFAPPGWPQTLLGCLGTLGISMSFPTVYIYSGELFPTVIRNVAVGTCSMCARFGSMAAPFVAGLASVHHWLPPTIFAVTALVGGLLCLKLPETMGKELPDTLHEAEHYDYTAKASANGHDNTGFKEEST